MSAELSTALDLARFFAALAVVAEHAGRIVRPLPWGLDTLGHEAVMVFFVMSGFIIERTTAARDGSARDYLVARWSRVWSVGLPGLTFTWGMLWLLWATGHAVPTGSNSALNLLAHSLYLDMLLGFNAEAPLNPAFWSLTYEVWYYALFGLVMFARAPWRLPLLLAWAVLAGPAIWLLLPVWWLGVVVARAGAAPGARPPGAAWALAALALGLAVPLIVNAASLDEAAKTWLRQHVPGFWRVNESQRVLTDYAIALALAAALWAFEGLPAALRRGLLKWRPAAKALAGMSFTLYLFHMPLAHGLAALPAPWSARDWPQGLTLAVIVAACWGLSFLGERRLAIWRESVEGWVPASWGAQKARG